MKILNNKIIFPEVYKKGTEVKVYFYRSPVEDFTLTKIDGSRNFVDWHDGYEIDRVEVRKPRLFGIFKRKWFSI